MHVNLPISYHLYKSRRTACYKIDPVSRALKPSKTQMLLLLATHTVPLLVLDVSTVKRYSGAVIPPEDLSSWPILERRLPLTAPSVWSIFGQLLGSLFIFDLLFTVLHFGLHHIPVLYRKLHSTHHSHGAIDVTITTQLELIEQVSIVLLANESLKIVHAHPLTRSLFVFIFVYLFVDNHSGLDFPHSYDKVTSVCFLRPLIHAI